MIRASLGARIDLLSADTFFFLNIFLSSSKFIALTAQRFSCKLFLLNLRNLCLKHDFYLYFR